VCRPVGTVPPTGTDVVVAGWIGGKARTVQRRWGDVDSAAIVRMRAVRARFGGGTAIVGELRSGFSLGGGDGRRRSEGLFVVLSFSLDLSLLRSLLVFGNLEVWKFGNLEVWREPANGFRIWNTNFGIR